MQTRQVKPPFTPLGRENLLKKRFRYSRGTKGHRGENNSATSAYKEFRTVRDTRDELLFRVEFGLLLRPTVPECGISNGLPGG